MQLDARSSGAHRTHDARNDHRTDNSLRSKSARPAHRVPAPDADPAIISSMISSLDTSTPSNSSATGRSSSPRTLSEHKTKDARSESGAPRSTSNTALRQNLALRSYPDTQAIGIAVEYEQQGMNNPPSGSFQSANTRIIAATSPKFPGPSSPSFSMRNVGSQTPLRPRPSSRGSTFSTASTQASRQNKLSAESWVRYGIQDDIPPPLSQSQTPTRALRRKGSQKSLRPANLNTLPSRAGVEQEGGYPITGEHIIIAPKSPSQLVSPKSRLFLRDSLIAENETTLDPALDQVNEPEDRLVLAPEIDITPSSDSVVPAASIPPPNETPRTTRTSSTADTISQSDKSLSPPRMIANGASPIIDSIPTRTSSLRQSSKSPSKKKEKSSKKKSMLAFGKSESVFARRSKPIPESSWADLGEDDETVKRIRELRELRETRLQRVNSETYPGYTSPPFPSSDVTAENENASQQNTPTRLGRPSPGDRALSAPDKVRQASLADSHTSSGGSRSGSRDDAGLKVNGTNHAPRRPSPAPSDRNVPSKLSLEYSYTDAVDTMQDETPNRNNRKSVFITSSDISQKGDSSAQSFATPSSTKRTRWDKGEKSPRQASAPSTDLERRKSRRKSMSDARNRRLNEDEPQQQRRDSLEDSVMEYLNSPRLTQMVYNKTNTRKIAYSEVGDPNGAVVFVCVGMGLTRYVTVFYDELATTLRLRLITLDRPGVGGSGPYPTNDRSGPLSWPDDILAICQELGITKFSILAHSAGAIYALATSLILPQMLIGKVHLLAPWIPPSQLEAVPHQTTSASPASGLPRSQRFLRVLPTPLLRAANAAFMSPTSGSTKSSKTRAAKPGAIKAPLQSGESPRSSPQARERSVSQDNRRESMMLMDRFMPTANPLEAYSDSTKDGGDFDPALKRGSLVLSATAFPTDPSFSYAASALNAAEHTEKKRQAHYTSRLTERTWELATRDSNPATDLLVCLERHRDIGFRYTDIKRQIVITHGIEDKRVPAANIRWLADQMNRRAQAIPGSSYANAPPSRDGWADPAHARGGCEVRILQGEGHGLMASPSIMSDILAEIAGYWVGQDRGYVPV